MFHFFPKFASNVEDTPLAAELRRLQVPHRIFAQALNRQYKSRLGLVLRIYPLLTWRSLRIGLSSVMSEPKPDAVVVTSDVEALVFAILCWFFSRRTQIVFETFIATPRRSFLAGKLHHLYYGLVLKFVSAAICHSRFEADRYAALFPRVSTRFICLPYALSVNGREELRDECAGLDTSDVIVAAGRSGRDYATLANAIRGLPCRLRIICDWERPTQDVPASDQITILRGCFGRDYLAELAKARLVVIPLSQRSISAGQMVLLQAFALKKPVIITDTATTREYATNGHEALLADFACAADMRAKISALLADRARCQSLGQSAFEHYERSFSTEVYVRKLVSTLDELTRGRHARPGASVAKTSLPLSRAWSARAAQ